MEFVSLKKSMNKIPKKLRDQLSEDPYYHVCARSSDACEGRITWEHALLYAGKQVQERFAIIPLCEFHHLGAGLVKKINVVIALGRAIEEDVVNYPLLPWELYGLKR